MGFAYWIAKDAYVLGTDNRVDFDNFRTVIPISMIAVAPYYLLKFKNLYFHIQR